MSVTAVVLSVFLAVVFVATGVGKIVKQDRSVTNARHLGYSVGAFQAIGALEVIGAVSLVIGIFWKPLGIAAVTGFVLLMLGAAMSHLRAKDRIPVLMASLVLTVVSAATLALLVLAP